MFFIYFPEKKSIFSKLSKSSQSKTIILINNLLDKTSKFSSTVPLGETWNMQLNITDPGADYIYLKKECQKCAENRLKSLTKVKLEMALATKRYLGAKNIVAFTILEKML